MMISGEDFPIFIPEEKPCDQNAFFGGGECHLHSLPLSPSIHPVEEEIIVSMAAVVSLAASACQGSMKHVRPSGRGRVDPR